MPNVYFQSRLGKSCCPTCSARLADSVTEEEHAACQTADELRRLTNGHYTHGWYAGLIWHTGPAFCRACVGDVFGRAEWEALFRSAANNPRLYVPLLRGGGELPAWLTRAFWKAAAKRSAGNVVRM